MISVGGGMAHRVWGHRWLFLNFFQREVKNRYSGSIIGIFWALIQPVALLAVYVMVFSTIFRVKFPELEGHGFVVFVAVALWPWMAFQEGIQRGMTAIQNNAGLVKKVAFPHEMLVHGAVAATFAIHLTGMLFVLLILTLSGMLKLNAISLPLVVVTLLTLYLAASGLAFVLAAIQTMIRDAEHFVVPLFMVLFYLTPILYPASLVPKEIHSLIALNPLSFLIERMRDVFLFEHFLPVWGDAVALALGGVVFVAGRWFFNRLSPHFEDFL